MITNSGKNVIAKYLLGQINSYATHIAIGCGQTPLSPTDSMPLNLSQKEVLDFEMARIPITSRGFVKENGETKISLTAELPTENRYEITEIGLWSSGSNTLARQFDSRIIFNFKENWQAHNISVLPIPVKSALGTGVDIVDDGDTVFIANNGDKVLKTQDRLSRREGPRFLDKSIFMRGDSSNIESEDVEITSASSSGSVITYLATNDFSEGDVVTIAASSNNLFNFVAATVTSATSASFTIAKNVASTEISVGGAAWISGSWTPQEELDEFVSTHIHLAPISFNINRNNPSDELVLALSVVDKKSDGSNGTPDFVKIILQFFRNEIDQSLGFAKAELYIDSSELTNNMYKVFRFPISDLITSPDFTSSEISIARIFSAVYVEDDGDFVTSENHYVALDGFRLDNIATQNPLYKMVGYSPTITQEGTPILKLQNTSNYVEFRFGLGVV
jgi:hypothetical protein